MDATGRAAIRSTLARSEWFASLAPHELDELAAICAPRRLEAGAVLFREGDPGDSMFVVAAGELKIRVAVQDGDVLLNTLGPGDLVGEIAALDGSSRTASATASMPTELLAIEARAFHGFLAATPHYAGVLLQLLAARIRTTSQLFPDLGSLNAGAGGAGDPADVPAFQVTLVGYGRYGNSYIGPKYAKRGYPWQVVAVVDPQLARGRFAASVLGRAQPDTPLFPSFEAWHDGYFMRLAPERRAHQVVEIPLKPELVYEQALRYLDAGVRQLILPKPVVMNEAQLADLTRRVEAARAKAAVASQWYYSDFPRIIAREIRHIAAERGAPVQRVAIEFSKENGLAYATPPALLELPHVLQLLTSIGLVDPARDTPDVAGSPTLVALTYRPPQVADGVHVRASTDYRPAAAEKRKYPSWDYQERSLKVFFADDPAEPGLAVDFWIKFARSGDLVVRPGQIAIRSRLAAGGYDRLALQFVEDQLLTMNEQIYAAFGQDFASFQRDPRVLSLERYGAIGRQLMQIEARWQAACAP